MDEIRRMRLAAGITQQALADKAGVSQALIARIERGAVDTSYSKMKKILDVLVQGAVGRNINVSDIMSKSVFSIRSGEKIRKAARIMKLRNISQLPVIEDGKVLGSISEKDISRTILEKKESLFVADVMSDPPPIISINTNASVLSGLLDYHSAVLVSQNGRIRGIITRADMLKLVRY